MRSSGSGLTFNDQDVKMVRVVVGLLSRASGFKDLGIAGIVEAAPAIHWLNELVDKIKANVFDLSQARIVEPAPEESQLSNEGM